MPRISTHRVSSHPGEILREEYLAPLDMSANALARHLGVDTPRINDIVRERRAVTPDTALRLGVFFNTGPGFWMNLQLAHDLSKAQLEVGKEIRRSIRPLEPAAE